MQSFVLVVMGLALSLPASCLQELMGHLKGPGGSSALVSSSTNSSDDHHGALAAAQPLRRSQRLWASVTPEAVSSMQGITTVELAGQPTEHATKSAVCMCAIRTMCRSPLHWLSPAQWDVIEWLASRQLLSVCRTDRPRAFFLLVLSGMLCVETLSACAHTTGYIARH
jgi:hypothetical protein